MHLLVVLVPFLATGHLHNQVVKRLTLAQPRLMMSALLYYWSLLLSSRYKVNFDATTFNDLNASEIGVVIRNDEGEFIAALSKHIDTRMIPTVAESIATLCCQIYL